MYKDKTKKLAYYKRYYQDHQESYKTKSKKYYDENREKVLSQKKDYYKRNADVIKKRVSENSKLKRKRELDKENLEKQGDYRWS